MAFGTDAIGYRRRFVRVLADPFMEGSRKLPVTVSLGVAEARAGDDAETLIRRADMAMYEAKASGRNNYRFYSEAMNLRSVERLDAVATLCRDRGSLVRTTALDVRDARHEVIGRPGQAGHPSRAVEDPVHVAEGRGRPAPGAGDHRVLVERELLVAGDILRSSGRQHMGAALLRPARHLIRVDAAVAALLLASLGLARSHGKGQGQHPKQVIRRRPSPASLSICGVAAPRLTPPPLKPGSPHPKLSKKTIMMLGFAAANAEVEGS